MQVGAADDFEAGSLGCGHALKALNNLVAAAAFTATAEALLIGKRFGLDPARMIEVMNVSTARNFHTDVVMSEHVIGGKGLGFGLDFAVVTDPATIHTMQGTGSIWWGGAAGTWRK